MCNILFLLFLFVCVVIWFACFICVCITMCALLANKWATLWAACLDCAKLALHHGASSWATICRRGGMLKDAMVGLLACRLFVLCYRLISIGHRLSFTCFKRVLKGFLVFSTAECSTLPLDLFSITIRLV